MSNRMWGGRFGGSPDDIMEEINASIGFDQRLFAQDIRGRARIAKCWRRKALFPAKTPPQFSAR